MMQFFLCILVPTLFLAIYITEHNRSLHAAKSEITSWRLDTSTNYTMDLNYWKKQTTPEDRHYYFNISTIVEAAPDGIVRNLTVINGQYPGPLIEANAGDTLYIHVQNQMLDDPTTIHCHGLFFNQGQSFNDGAAYINQCPIPPNGGKYTYEIKLDENQWGTYWYHSHYGAQYADGVFGPLVIHSAKERALIDDYDEDIVIMVNDYYHDMANDYLPEYLGPDNENNEPTPDDGLIEGTNKFNYNSATYVVPNGDSRNVTYVNSTLPVINLDKKKKYRFRLINAGFFAPINFGIDKHVLQIIEADGTNTEKATMDSIDMSVGQRYSFFLQKPDEELSHYWMRARFDTFCIADGNSNLNTEIDAIVTYEKNLNVDPATESWPYNGGDVQCRDLNQTLLKSLDQKVPLVSNGSTKPDVIIELDVSFLIGAYQLDRGYFNDMTYTALKNSSTMYELAFDAENNPIRVLGDSSLQTKNNGQYLLNFDKRGQIVDLVLNNYDDGAHPFHMHGHKFWVLTVGDKGYFREEYYDPDMGKMNFDNAIARDVVGISGFGYAVLRFVVDNPGVWPFHCHIGWHIESGLMMQINELQSEYSNWSTYPQSWADLCRAIE